MSAYEDVVSRLHGVRRLGNGRVAARCPAHEDKRPSLSVREGADGRVLLHCFSGCSAAEVVDALGFEFRDLFPPSDLPGSSINYYTRDQTRRKGPAISARECLILLDVEAHVVLRYANRLHDCGLMTDQEIEDLDIAIARLRAIIESWRLAA